jgi:hypothetical protein
MCNLLTKGCIRTKDCRGTCVKGFERVSGCWQGDEESIELGRSGWNIEEEEQSGQMGSGKTEQEAKLRERHLTEGCRQRIGCKRKGTDSS